MIYYVNMRQAYLMNPTYASKLPSRTVLYTAVPADYLNQAAIRGLLGPTVRNVWFPTNTKKLDDIVEERQKDAMKLEGAETDLIRKANGLRLKPKKGAAPHDPESGTLGAMQYLTAKDRPTHRTKFLIGKKVDTIEWTRAEIARLTPIIEEEQAKHRAGDAKLSGAVFVEFDTLGSAQAAYQSLTHHQLLKMAPRWTGMAPAEVIWDNLNIGGAQRFIRTWITAAIVIALIIYWSVPVAFVGVISNLSYWISPTGKTPWLGFLNKLPPSLLGIVTGLLPTIMLAVLMALLPPFLRWMAKLGGSPTTSDVEYKTSNYYFGFQVVQVFLVTTLSSAVSGSIFNLLDNPSQVPSLLAQGLPTANGFYLSYIILQGLGVVSGMLASVAGLVVTPLLAKFLGNTPRKLFQKWNSLQSISYGTVFPIYTNLLVIGKPSFLQKFLIADSCSYQLLVHCTSCHRLRSCWSVVLLRCLQVQHLVRIQHRH
jgi:calcium permeable stress-gated cation channel